MQAVDVLFFSLALDELDQSDPVHDHVVWHNWPA